MSTILYPSPIFGPIQSRRLGVSLGINLMPADGKLCSFDCVYCECGFNGEHTTRSRRPSREEVAAALEKTLRERHEQHLPLDVLTFAGNGEPTLHPDFPGIIDDTIRLRDQYFPEAKVSVLSNATMTHKESVRDALMRVDNNIQKIDSVSNDYIHLVDRPAPNYRVEKVIEDLCKFEGHVIIQTMFMGGTMTLQWSSGDDDVVVYDVSNYSDEFVNPWLEALQRIKPQQVMIYTIDRETPAEGLLKAEPAVLDAIAERVKALGFPCSVSY